MSSYCDFILTDTSKQASLHRHYHDFEYGFPLTDDSLLFERFALEINQAGLNWGTILAKKDNFKIAFEGYDIALIAQYQEADFTRLLGNPGIIRNRLKINAVIYNAQQILMLQEKFGSFKTWLDTHYKLSLNQWIALFKTTFKFTGPEIVKEFLQSTGYIPGAHSNQCPIYARIIKAEPMWLKKPS